MMQNLNLYQLERVRREGPQKAQMLLGLAVLAVVCLLHSAWLGWQLYQAGTLLAGAKGGAQAQEADLATAKAGFVEPVLDQNLPGELAVRQAENHELQRLLDYLELLASQQATGFVALLGALSAQHPQSGLWLDGISLNEGGSQMRLRGNSQTPEDLPRYLERLGQNPQFKGREFARFDVRRGADQLLRFELSSRADDKEKASE